MKWTRRVKKFPTAKHFSSWLRLAPNNKISGGKTLSNHIHKGSNRLKIVLRNAANAVGNLKESDLGRFFKRIAFKKEGKQQLRLPQERLQLYSII
ncbi:transposase [Pedobacter sp. SYSU D00535]|uniref:transposase n=1 Tax=Pedobacter sp. SYSU D00535 TaxID=2810308 RepID=UPI001A96EAB3